MSKKRNKKALGKGIGALLSSMGNDPINEPKEPTNIPAKKIEVDATGTVRINCDPWAYSADYGS